MTSKGRTIDSSSVLDADDPASILESESVTFNWAGKFLTKNDRRKLSKLYTFCRYVDNLADDDAISEDASRRTLSGIREQLKTGQINRGLDKAVKCYLELNENHGLRIFPAIDLIDGLMGDHQSVRIGTEKQLIQYSYKVAGTVGLMIADIFNLEPAADSHALSLGIAMQISNIIRDVREDYERDRIYIPDEYLKHETIQRAINKDDSSAEGKLRQARQKMSELATRYYQHAEKGIHYLPFRVRPGIYTASRCYEAIGRKSATFNETKKISDLPISTVKLLLITVLAILKVFLQPDLNGFYSDESTILPNKNFLPDKVQDR